jgi:ABC-type sugar transport system substrate-binding protein
MKRTGARAFAGIAALTMSIALSACGSSDDGSSGGGSSSTGPKKVQIAMTILHNAAKYYQEEKAGAIAFAKEDGHVDLQITGPPTYDAQVSQKQVLDLLAKGPAAMGFTPQPPDTWTRTMKTVAEQLPGKVIAYSERPASEPQSAQSLPVKTDVGLNDRTTSREGLEATIKAANIPASSTGKVLLGACTPETSGTVALRLAGFVDAVKALLPKAQIIQFVSAADVTANEDRWANKLSTNTDAILAAGTCEPDGQSLYRIKKANNYPFVLGALEMTPESAAGLKSGVTTAVQSSNTWLMGYTVARMLTMAARGEKLPEGFVPTKATTFTKANLDELALRESDPAKFYAKDIQALFANGMPTALPMEDAWK